MTRATLLVLATVLLVVFEQVHGHSVRKRRDNEDNVFTRYASSLHYYYPLEDVQFLFNYTSVHKQAETAKKHELTNAVNEQNFNRPSLKNLKKDPIEKLGELTYKMTILYNSLVGTFTTPDPDQLNDKNGELKNYAETVNQTYTKLKNRPLIDSGTRDNLKTMRGNCTDFFNKFRTAFPEARDTHQMFKNIDNLFKEVLAERADRIEMELIVYEIVLTPVVVKLADDYQRFNGVNATPGPETDVHNLNSTRILLKGLIQKIRNNGTWTMADLDPVSLLPNGVIDNSEATGNPNYATLKGLRSTLINLKNKLLNTPEINLPFSVAELNNTDWDTILQELPSQPRSIRRAGRKLMSETKQLVQMVPVTIQKVAVVLAIYGKLTTLLPSTTPIPAKLNDLSTSLTKTETLVKASIMEEFKKAGLTELIEKLKPENADVNSWNDANDLFEDILDEILDSTTTITEEQAKKFKVYSTRVSSLLSEWLAQGGNVTNLSIYQELKHKEENLLKIAKQNKRTFVHIKLVGFPTNCYTTVKDSIHLPPNEQSLWNSLKTTVTSTKTSLENASYNENTLKYMITQMYQIVNKANAQTTLSGQPQTSMNTLCTYFNELNQLHGDL